MPHIQKKNGLKARPPVPGRLPFQYSHPSPERLDLTFRPEGRAERSVPLWPWVLAAVVGVWMFGLGVVVGRHTVPVDMGEDVVAELEQLRAEEAEADAERMTRVAEELASTPFAFYDALAEGDAGVPPPAAKEPAGPEAMERPAEEAVPLSGAPDTPPEIKRIKVPKRPVSEAAPKPAAARPAVPAAKPAPKPESESIPAPSRVSEGQYAVQVASFAVSADAERLATGLKGKGYEGVYISDEPGPDGTIRYRVKIGHYRTYADAQELQAKLKSRERIHDAFVSRR
jgi:cell division septation protein DedD